MTTHRETAPPAVADAFGWRFVTPMFMGSALNPVNSSLIATALVPIAGSMGVSVGRTAILVSALYLASSIAQPTAGKLSEELGPRRVFLAGILLVLAGGLVGGFAQNLAMLVAARVLIGVGTSAGYPSAMLLVRRRAVDAGRPFFDLRLLGRNRPLSRTYLRWAILCLCTYTVLYGVTQWLQAGRGLSALAAGLVLLPMSLLSGIIARPVSQRNLLRTPLVIAGASCLVGSAGVLLLTRSTPLAVAVVVTLVFGITLGTGASTNQTALYVQVDAAQIGTASGLLRTFGYIGSIASSAIISIVFQVSVSDHGLHVIAIIMTAVSAVALLVTLADRRLMAVQRADG